MQTFLPYASFRDSVRVLDNRRLAKQRVETYQILRSLLFAQYAWKNHPAVRMWRGFVPALVSYGVAACDAWTERGYRDTVKDSLLEFTAGLRPDEYQLQHEGRLPPWLGVAKLHLSHQSALLNKEPETYRDAFAGVPADLPYFWPADCFPRWPFRRPGPEPISPDDALNAAGFDEFRPGQQEAVDAIAGGRDVLWCLPSRAGATSAALMASLTRPPITLWVWPGPPPDLGDPHSSRKICPSSVPQGTRPLAPSTARPPTEADHAAIAAEVAAEHEHFYRRACELPRTGDGPDGTGLMVVEEAVHLTAAERSLVAGGRRRGTPLMALAGTMDLLAARTLGRQLGLSRPVLLTAPVAAGDR